MIQGIDISRHQGDVQFDKVEQSGMKFCFCKASEGGDYHDPAVRIYWEQLRETTMYRGLYHFARPDLRVGRKGGEVEGRNFVDLAQSLGGLGKGCLPPVLDFEKYSESDYKDNIPWIQGWLDVVEGELGRPGAIYTGANIWKYEVANTASFADRALWQVDYTATRDEPKMMADGAWKWTWWQWSGGGDFAYADPVPGVNGACDVNRFNGSQADLDVLAMVSAPPIVESVPGIMPTMSPRDASPETVKQLQGLLLAAGFGPDGLVGSNGRPDGIAGSKTLAALSAWNTGIGADPDFIESSTWYTLLSRHPGSS